MVTLPDLRAAVIATLPAISGPLTTTNDTLIHELHVHQIELEMQNEELKRINRDLEIVNTKYVDLYEFSPIGFLTLTIDGKVVSTNFSCTELLNADRLDLIGHRFEEFIDLTDQDKWYVFFQGLQRLEHKSIEIKLKSIRESHVLIQCVTSMNSPDDINFALTDVSIQNAREARSIKLAYHDSLTSLPNRLLLFDRIEQELLNSSRYKHFSSLMFLDLDNFKFINDTYGHDVGDIILVEVANRLLTLVRETDTVSRLGGDEFVVVFNNVGSTHKLAKSQTLEVAEKIKSSISDTLTISIDGVDTIELNNTVSIGVVIFTGTKIEMAQLLKYADSAMYQAKQLGRNIVQLFE